MDRASFPTLAKYLDRLPHGCDSYPGCLCKVSLARTAILEKPFLIAPGALPPPLEDLFTRPPPMSLWIPEVHVKAAMLALKDAHFPGSAGRPAFRQWTYDLAARLFRAPIYRVMFFVLSPSRLLRGYDARWHTFHRGGVETRIVDATDRALRMRVTYPQHLYCEYGLMGLSTSIAAALDAAGGRSVRVDALPLSSGEAELDCRWEE